MRQKQGSWALPTDDTTVERRRLARQREPQSGLAPASETTRDTDPRAPDTPPVNLWGGRGGAPQSAAPMNLAGSRPGAPRDDPRHLEKHSSVRSLLDVEREDKWRLRRSRSHSPDGVQSRGEGVKGAAGEAEPVVPSEPMGLQDDGREEPWAKGTDLLGRRSSTASTRPSRSFASAKSVASSSEGGYRLNEQNMEHLGLNERIGAGASMPAEWSESDSDFEGFFDAVETTSDEQTPGGEVHRSHLWRRRNRDVNYS